MQALFATATLVALSTALAAQSPLTTTFADDNSGAIGGAVYFDMTAAVNLDVTGIDINLSTVATTTGSVDIYMCPTTYVGNESSPALWTLIGNGTAVSNGPGVPSILTLASPIVLPAGSNGYAYVGTGHSFAYTNGNGTNQNYNTNELSLSAGAAINAAFSGTAFTPRVVNTSISYTIGASGTFATKVDIGAGCTKATASFYEHFATTQSIDLSPLGSPAPMGFQMLPTNPGYVVLPAPPSVYLDPSRAGSTATNLNLGDDTEAVVALSSAFPYAGGTTNSLTVCSNGFISIASNGTSYQPSPTAMLNWAETAWAVWHDFICNTTGNVWFEENGSVAYFTWLNVIGYQGTAAGTDVSTFQLQFDTTSGIVTFWFESMDNISQSGWSGGDGYVVGYTPAGSLLDPGNMDLTAPSALPIVLGGADISPLGLSADLRPIQNTTMTFTTSNITPGAIFGGLALGFQNPALDLTPFGMPGCTQLADHVAVILFFPQGAPSVAVPFNVPAAVGVTLFAQSFAYDPIAALTPLGAVASQGMQLVIGGF